MIGRILRQYNKFQHESNLPDWFSNLCEFSNRRIEVEVEVPTFWNMQTRINFTNSKNTFKYLQNQGLWFLDSYLQCISSILTRAPLLIRACAVLSWPLETARYNGDLSDESRESTTAPWLIKILTWNEWGQHTEFLKASFSPLPRWSHEAPLCRHSKHKKEEATNFQIWFMCLKGSLFAIWLCLKQA